MKYELSIESEGSIRTYTKRQVFIPSRFFLAPINTGLTSDGYINQSFIDFHNLRSGHGLGITYVGNVSVAIDWKTNRNTPVLSEDSIQEWGKVASVITRNGSVPAIQLGCRVSKHKPLREWKREDSETFVKRARHEFSEIPAAKIRSIFEAFFDSARLAIKAGFKVIQLHAAHGYFLSQLLDPRLNHRKDFYGSDSLAAIRSLISDIRTIDQYTLIDIRLSLTEGFEGESAEYKRKIDLLDHLLGPDLDMVSLSSGTYDLDKTSIYPPKSWGHGPYIGMAVPLATKYPDLIWNVAGNIWDIREIPLEIPDNLTFSMARALIADPEIVGKSLSGNFNAIRWCTRGGDCHYYSKDKQHIYCPLEPSLSDESLVSVSECISKEGSCPTRH
jgi:2,4-dienoyl-CoA reductase-like NADH-dependent reductase (Old Yellow Enzyme family)